MNRLDIIKTVAKNLSTKGEAARAVETTFETIRNALKNGDKVEFMYFMGEGKAQWSGELG